MGRKRKCIKTEKEKEEVKIVVNQPRWVGNKMSWISWKLFEAESCLLSFGFSIYIRDSLTCVYFCFNYFIRIYQWLTESLAELMKTDSWTPLTVSDSVGTEESAFLTRTVKMLLV